MRAIGSPMGSILPILLIIAAATSSLAPASPELKAMGHTPSRQDAVDVIRVPYDYKTISEAVGAAGPSTVILVYSGVYRENIVIRDKRGISIIGVGDVTITGVSSKTPIIEIDGSLNITVSNIRVHGGNLTDYPAAIRIRSSYFITIANTTIEHVYVEAGSSYAKLVTGSPLAPGVAIDVEYPCSMISLVNVSMVDSGITFAGPLPKIDIRGVTVNGKPLVIVHDVDLGGARLSTLYPSAGEIILYNVSNAIISGYSIASTYAGIIAVASSNIAIEECVLANNTVGIIASSRNVSIRRCTLRSNVIAVSTETHPSTTLVSVSLGFIEPVEVRIEASTIANCIRGVFALDNSLLEINSSLFYSNEEDFVASEVGILRIHNSRFIGLSMGSGARTLTCIQCSYIFNSTIIMADNVFTHFKLLFLLSTMNNPVSIYDNIFIDSGIIVHEPMWPFARRIARPLFRGNTVNGKPMILVYSKDLNGRNLASLYPNAGELILVNVSNAVIEGYTFNGGYVGVSAAIARDISIRRCSFVDMLAPIVVYEGANISITGNTIKLPSIGVLEPEAPWEQAPLGMPSLIEAVATTLLNISYNTIDPGIPARAITAYASNTTISYNNISNTHTAIELWFPSNVLIYMNRIHNVTLCINTWFPSSSLHAFMNEFIGYKYGLSCNSQTIPVGGPGAPETLGSILLAPPSEVVYMYKGELFIGVVGNYWGKSLPDADGDGVSEEAYNVPAPPNTINITDTHPLVSKIGSYRFIALRSDILEILRPRSGGAVSGRLDVLIKLVLPAHVVLELIDDKGFVVKRVDAGDIVAGAHSISVDVSNLEDGVYKARVLALLREPPANVSRELTIVIDNKPPRLAVYGPRNDTVLSGTINMTILVMDVTLRSVVAIISSGNRVDVIPLYTYGEQLVPQPRTWVRLRISIDTTRYSDGALNVTIVARDMAGATSSSTITYTIDNSPPHIMLVSPRNGSYVSGLTSLSLAILEANPLELYVVVANESLASLDTVYSGPVVERIPINTSRYCDGWWRVIVMCRDAAGHYTTRLYRFYFDNTPPIVNIVSPWNNTRVVKGRRISISWSFTEDNYLETLLYIDGSLWENVTGNTSYILDTSELTPGTHRITVVVIDKAGNTGNATLVIAVKESILPKLELPQAGPWIIAVMIAAIAGVLVIITAASIARARRKTPGT